jgi:hypothetical protein
VGHDLRVVARQHAPQLRHIQLDHLRRRRRRVLSPQPIDQAIDAHRGVRLQSEHRQQRPLLGRAKRDRPAVERRLDRPEELKIHTDKRSLSAGTSP